MGHSGSVQVCNPNRTEDVPHDLPIRESSPGGSYGTVPLRRTSELSRSRSGFGLRDARLTYVGRPPRDAITVDLACSGADLDLRPDRSDGAIWTACWS
jgi:hypothetical protein